MRFGNLHFQSIIGALLYVSCCTRPDITYAVNKLAKFANNPGITHYRALLHLIGFLKRSTNKGLKFYYDPYKTLLYSVLRENNINVSPDSILTFSDSSWNDCIDTGRSTGHNITMIQAGAVDYSSHLPIHVAMSSREAEYISAAVACMRASHIRTLVYNLKFLGKKEYNSDEPVYEPVTIIIDNKAAISMAKCNKDTAGNHHVARRYHYVRQGTALNKHKFEWIGTKFRLLDTLTKPGTPTAFSLLWDLQVIEMESES